MNGNNLNYKKVYFLFCLPISSTSLFFQFIIIFKSNKYLLRILSTDPQMDTQWWTNDLIVYLVPVESGMFSL